MMQMIGAQLDFGLNLLFRSDSSNCATENLVWNNVVALSFVSIHTALADMQQ